jgi:hypothetical protein
MEVITDNQEEVETTTQWEFPDQNELAEAVKLPHNIALLREMFSPTASMFIKPDQVNITGLYCHIVANVDRMRKLYNAIKSKEFVIAKPTTVANKPPNDHPKVHPMSYENVNIRTDPKLETLKKSKSNAVAKSEPFKQTTTTNEKSKIIWSARGEKDMQGIPSLLGYISGVLLMSRSQEEEFLVSIGVSKDCANLLTTCPVSPIKMAFTYMYITYNPRIRAKLKEKIGEGNVKFVERTTQHGRLEATYRAAVDVIKSCNALKEYMKQSSLDPQKVEAKTETKTEAKTDPIVLVNNTTDIPLAVVQYSVKNVLDVDYVDFIRFAAGPVRSKLIFATNDRSAQAHILFAVINENEESRSKYKSACDMYDALQPRVPLNEIKPHSTDKEECNGTCNGKRTKPSGTIVADCVICFNETCEVILLPCAHVCLCRDCGVNSEFWKKCPICKSNVNECKKIFFV